MSTQKPSSSEDEFIAKQEAVARHKAAVDKARQMAASEREAAKKLHWMKCPKCGSDLEEIELHGVKVDQCAHCGGVFLDKGELDRLEHHDQGVMHRVFSMFR